MAANKNDRVRKVFISSTYVDLQEYRKVAIDVLLRHKCQPLAMEHFLAQPKEPEEVCNSQIEECDVFVGIYAHRYGFIPRGKRKSITQLQYELAKKLDKDCLCFVIAHRHPWLPEFIEKDKYNQLEVFLQRVKDKETVAKFTSKSSFEAKNTRCSSVA